MRVLSKTSDFLKNRLYKIFYFYAKIEGFCIKSTDIRIKIVSTDGCDKWAHTRKKTGNRGIFCRLYILFITCVVQISLNIKKRGGGCARLKRDKIRKIEAVEKFA